MGIALWMGLSVLLMANGHTELGALGIMALVGSAGHRRRVARTEGSRRAAEVPSWHPEASR